MFSDNRKISKRQITRLLIYDITGISTLLLPAMLARIAGKDGIFCIFLALIPAYLFTVLMEILQKKMRMPYPSYIKQKTGNVFSKILFADLLYLQCPAGGICSVCHELPDQDRVAEGRILLADLHLYPCAGRLWDHGRN